MRIPEGRQEARRRVIKIVIAIEEAIDEVLEAHDYEISYAELQLAMVQIQQSWAEKVFQMETPGEDSFAHISKEHAQKIFDAGAWSVPDEKRIDIDKQEPGEDYGPDFETWWEQNSG